VVAEATFRLHHIPAAQQWLRHPVDGGDGLRALLRGYADLRVEPSALELDVDLDTGSGTLDALLEGTADGVAERVARVRSVLGGRDCPGPSSGSSPDADPSLGDRDLVLQVVVAPGGVAAVLDLLRAEQGPARRARMTGRAGVGVLRVAVPDVAAVAAPGVLAAVRRLAGRYDGTATVVHAPTGAELDVWGPVRGLALMRRVKQQFDPGQRLAPGRFVGGI
jgi:glycolate oxidase FAD binding subunit